MPSIGGSKTTTQIPRVWTLEGPVGVHVVQPVYGTPTGFRTYVFHADALCNTRSNTRTVDPHTQSRVANVSVIE